ncbi:MAG: nuclear transport factor 2 family protein [Thermoanaerobaculia bacterium]
MTPFAALIPFLALAASVDAAPISPRETVRCSEIAFSRSVEEGDPDRFASWIDPQARFLGAGVLQGPEQVRTAWAAFFAPDGPRIAWRPSVIEVLEDGTLALTRGPYRLREPDGAGGRRESWGTFTSVWRRTAEGWRVVFDAGSPETIEPTPRMQALLEDPSGCPDGL